MVVAYDARELPPTTIALPQVNELGLSGWVAALFQRIEAMNPDLDGAIAFHGIDLR